MPIAVLSDTHGHVGNLAAALPLLVAAQPAAILHCGDVCGAAIVEMLSPWPTHYVYGNCDLDRDQLAESVRAAGQTWHAAFGAIDLAGVQIALLHSDDARRFETTIHSGDYDLVCYGHTHIQEHHRVGRTLVLNPGALYRTQTKTFALVDLPELTVEIVRVPA